MKRTKKHLCIIHQTCGPKPCPLCKQENVESKAGRSAGDGQLDPLDGRRSSQRDYEWATTKLREMVQDEPDPFLCALFMRAAVTADIRAKSPPID